MDYSYCGYNTDYPYRYLKSSGFDAALELFSQKNHSESTVEQSIARFESLISRYRNLDDGMRSKIARTVEDNSEDGIVYTDTTVTMGTVDISALSDFIETNDVDKGIIVADKGFGYSAAKKAFDSRPDLHFLIPLKRNADCIRKYMMYEFNSNVPGFKGLASRKDI